MTLSVIVPSLNGEVPESLFRQVEGRADVELVLVQGVSPVGKARNVGLGRAKGEYVAWVDADDEVAEDWTETILEGLATGTTGSRVDGLLFDAEAIGWQFEPSFVYGEGRGSFVGADLAHEIYRDERLKSHLWRWVLRRELWADESFDEEVVALEDYLVLPKVVAKAKEIKYLPRKLYSYLYHGDSAVNMTDDARDAASVLIAIRRYREATAASKRAALWGAATMAYWSLDKVFVDNRAVGSVFKSALQEGRKFLGRHLWALWLESAAAIGTLGMRLRWMARFVTATVGWWGLQRWCARRRTA